MARRAHSLGHRGLVLSIDTFYSTPSYMVRANRLLSSRLVELGRKYPINLISNAGDYGLPVVGEGTGMYTDDDKDAWLIGPSMKLGSLLCDGIGQSVEVNGGAGADDRVTLAFNVLQAAGS